MVTNEIHVHFETFRVSLFLQFLYFSHKHTLVFFIKLLLVLSLTADILEHAKSFQILQKTEPERIKYMPQYHSIVQWHTKGPLSARTKAKGTTKAQ